MSLLIITVPLSSLVYVSIPSTTSTHVIVFVCSSYVPPSKDDLFKSILYGNASTIVTCAFPI